MRIAADLDETRPHASANLAIGIKCFGSDRNVANALLENIAPDGPHAVTLRGGHIVVDYALSVRANAQTHRGELRAVANAVDFTLTDMSIERFGRQPGDFLFDQKLADFDLTPARVAAIATSKLERPLAAAAPSIAALLLAGLRLDDPDDPRRLTLVGVEVDADASVGAHTMRFEAMRTDKACFFRPGGRIVDGRFVAGEGEWVCIDPPAVPPPQQSCHLVGGRLVCLPPPRLPQP